MLILMLNLGAVQAVEVAPDQVLTVISAGAGDPVVLLPGLSGCAYGYRKIVPPLQEQGFRTIIIEPLGIGSSSRPGAADYSLTGQADRVAAAMDALDLKGAIIVGHGVSASVALRIAYRRPDLVQAVVSVEGGPDESAANPTVANSLKFASVVVKLGGGRLLRDKFKSSLENASGDPTWLDRRTLGRYLKNINADTGRCIDTLRAMAEASEPESLQDNLQNINCPVLLMTGEAPHSGAVTADEVEILSAGLVRFSRQQVPGAGHFIFEEQPEVVVAAIRSLNEELGRLSCAQ
ncbi:MAG: alpha/beta hydrolase [Acidobacteria bacterium]|uniref:Alpha/beta hydrolase n=1 Tax=Candidatus Polarisedimenticola svalbardensis TaxID=2886004 RepID=A0A8J6YAE4_9BACT|nr:alpha/beta hydrolase [Candidatus Polarisedimenticola svalbardensis]